MSNDFVQFGQKLATRAGEGSKDDNDVHNHNIHDPVSLKGLK
jgi:hypothetical protein